MYDVAMKRTLQALNRMVEDGVIEGYLIGGAVAAAYYVEPTATQDLDIFFQLAPSESGLMSLSPLYAYLRAHGYQPEGETVNPLCQSLPPLPNFFPYMERLCRWGHPQLVRRTFPLLTAEPSLGATSLTPGVRCPHDVMTHSLELLACSAPDAGVHKKS